MPAYCVVHQEVRLDEEGWIRLEGAGDVDILVEAAYGFVREVSEYKRR